MNKSTKTNNSAQVAGLLPKDTDSEFVGVKDTKQVILISQGNTYPWASIPKWVYELCQKKFLSDQVAMEQLGALKISQDRQIELFIYHSYGCLNSTADIINHTLQPSENFRHSLDCPSLKWDTKDMTIDGVLLNERDVFIIDCYKADLPDKMIAHQLEISDSTLAFHKRNLMHKLNVQSKMGVLIKALNQDI